MWHLLAIGNMFFYFCFYLRGWFFQIQASLVSVTQTIYLYTDAIKDAKILPRYIHQLQYAWSLSPRSSEASLPTMAATLQSAHAVLLLPPLPLPQLPPPPLPLCCSRRATHSTVVLSKAMSSSGGAAEAGSTASTLSSGCSQDTINTGSGMLVINPLRHFGVPDVRPVEGQYHVNTTAIWESILGELNGNILKFLSAKELVR